MSGDSKTTEIRIRQVSKKTVKQLSNIADYYGITLASYMKRELLTILSNMPDHIKEYKKEED